MPNTVQLTKDGQPIYPVTDASVVTNLSDVAKSGDYDDLDNKPTIPTVPTISTDINADANSDVKTASPKAVKTFVEGKGYGTYSKPQNGIPKTDLASGVQTSLGKADSALQPGDAADVKDPVSNTGEFVFRASPVTKGKGPAKINEVRGKSLVWNQLVTPVSGAETENGVTYTFNSDGSVIFNGECSGPNRSNAFRYSNVQVIVGHKYFFSGTSDILYNNTNTGGLSPSASGGQISTCTNSGRPYFKVSGRSGVTYNNVKFFPFIIDLTLMFGAGNEPTTVDEFAALYPLPYYDYNAGQIINNKTQAIEAVGFNQWDEEMLFNKGLTTNGAVVTAPGFQTTSFIPVIPGNIYYYKSPKTATFTCWYDANQNFVSTGGPWANDNTKTVPSGVAFIRLQITGYGDTYNHDICINISDSSFNGQYEPYKKTTIALNLPTLTGKLNGEGESVVVFPDGMRGHGPYYDQLLAEDGYIRKATVKRNRFTCSDMTFLRTSSAGYNVYQLNLATIGAAATASFRDNSINNFGIDGVSSFNSQTIDTECYQQPVWNNQNIFIAFAPNRTISDFEMDYPLDTPLTYILDTPIPTTFKVDGGGTERRLPEDTATLVNAPFAGTLKYYMLGEGTKETLDENYATKEEILPPEVFWATYGTTTVAEIDAAVAEGKVVVCRRDSSSKLFYVLSEISGSYYYLTYLAGTTGAFLRLDKATGVWDVVAVPLQSTSERANTIAGNESDTNKYPSTKATYDAIHPAVVTTQPVGGFLPNVVYDLSELTGTITFALATPTDANIANAYYWTFETGATAPTITWPANITWIDGSAPTISASKHYEIMIRNGYGTYLEI